MTNVPAAQYLRVSTERQEYSLDCQSARIAKYAEENGFAFCHTYCDEAEVQRLVCQNVGRCSPSVATYNKPAANEELGK